MLPRLIASLRGKTARVAAKPAKSNGRFSKLLPSLVRRRLSQARSSPASPSPSPSPFAQQLSRRNYATSRHNSLSSPFLRTRSVRAFPSSSANIVNNPNSVTKVSNLLRNSPPIAAASHMGALQNVRAHVTSSGAAGVAPVLVSQQTRGTAVDVTNSTSQILNLQGLSKFNFLFSPELLGIDQEARRLDNEHKAARIPFNLAFDAAFDEVALLREKEEINVLEIGFGSGAVIEGTYDYFKRLEAKDGKKRKINICGIDKEARWLDYCNNKFSNEINNGELTLYEMDATNINDLLHLHVDMYNKFDIILFRFFLSHVINFEGVFKYMVRYLLSRRNGCCIIQDGIMPSPAGTVLLPQMHSLPDVIGSKYNVNTSRAGGAASVGFGYKRTDPEAEFPHLFRFANEIAAPVLSRVMRFDVEYVLPSLVRSCGMKTVWENEMTLGGLNGTFGFEMAISNLISQVQRFRLLGVIDEDEAKKIMKEIEYAKTLPQSRGYVLLPLITRVISMKDF